MHVNVYIDAKMNKVIYVYVIICQFRNLSFFREILNEVVGQFSVPFQTVHMVDTKHRIFDKLGSIQGRLFEYIPIYGSLVLKRGGFIAYLHIAPII